MRTNQFVLTLLQGTSWLAALSLCLYHSFLSTQAKVVYAERPCTLVTFRAFGVHFVYTSTLASGKNVSTRSFICDCLTIEYPVHNWGHPLAPPQFKASRRLKSNSLCFKGASHHQCLTRVEHVLYHSQSLKFEANARM